MSKYHQHHLPCPEVAYGPPKLNSRPAWWQKGSAGWFRSVLALAVAVSLLVSLPPAAGEEEGVEVEWVASAIPGPAWGVAVSGNYAYLAASSGLSIVNVSDPGSPTSVAFLGLPGYAWSMTVSGGYAYLTDKFDGLRVVDISNPLQPLEVGNLSTPGSARDVAVQGDFAYLADWNEGFRVIDISDPSDPREVASLATTGYPFGVAVAGDYAYLAAGHKGLQIVNISNPTDPQDMGSHATDSNASGVAVVGNFAYVTDWGGGLLIFNVTDPGDPEKVGSYDTSGMAASVAVRGDYGYVADGSGGLVIVNISDPSNPTREGGLDTPHYAIDIAVAGDHAYVADRDGGLRIIDVTDSTDPEEVGSYGVPGKALGLAVVGDFAYVADGSSGLHILDISDPSASRMVGSHDTPDSAYGVAIAGEYAYVVDGTSGLRIIDISDPTAPREVGSYDTPDLAQGVAVAGDFAFVADRAKGLRIINISDPTAPMEVGSYDTSGSATDVAVQSAYAYIADWQGGLLIIDISDPTDPTQVGSYNTPGQAKGVALADDYAYVADGTKGLQVIDISDPADPRRVGSRDTPGSAIDVVVEGGYAYVADDRKGLRVIEVFDPTNPQEVGNYDTPDYAKGVALFASYVYLADGETQLQILKVEGLNDLPTASIDSISPNPAAEGESVTFTASGSDADGTVVAYQWSSTLDGLLSTNASFSTSLLSAGDHTISFRVQDNEGAWSAKVTTNLQIYTTNQPPTATISYLGPSPAEEGEVVSFVGSGSDPDGTVVSYEWSSTIDGVFATSRNASSTALSPGNHTISFRVQDNNSLWSIPATANLTILARNVLPTAIILPTVPTTTNEGELVYLSGYGLDPDGIVVSYRWRSDLDGELGQGALAANLTLDFLSPGNHTLFFAVQDSDGEWSPEASTPLHVNALPTARIILFYPVEPEEGDSVSFIADASDPDGSIVAYKWISGFDGLFSTQQNPTYSNLSPGLHLITFLVQDNDGAWSRPDFGNLAIAARANAPPTAYIDALYPDPAVAGKPVFFVAFGTDTEGGVIEYQWDFEGDGTYDYTGSARLVNHTYSQPGNYTPTLRVRDNEGEWSAPVSVALEVRPAESGEESEIPGPGVGLVVAGLLMAAYRRRESPP